MRKSIKRTIMFLFLAAAVVAGCAPRAPQPTNPPPPETTKAAPSTSAKPAWEVKWDEAVAAARKEGKLTVSTFAGPETRQALTKAFAAKYGINLEFVVGNASENVPKIVAERRAGMYLVDAVIDGTSIVTNWSKQGVLDPIEPALLLPEVVDPKMWYDGQMPYFDNAHFGIGFLAQYNSMVLRNTELVKEGEIKSFRDLLKPEWKDKVVMYDPSVSGTGAALFAMLALGVWDQERAGNWFSQMLSEQNLTLSRDPRLQVEWVARGKYPIALATWTDQLVSFLGNGAPIAQQKVEEGGILTSSNGGVGIFNQPAHPNAALVFVNWLLTKEGQNVFVSAFGGPSRRNDIKAEGVYAALTPPVGEKVYIEDEERIMKKVDLMKVSGAIIGQIKR